MMQLFCGKDIVMPHVVQMIDLTHSPSLAQSSTESVISLKCHTKYLHQSGVEAMRVQS